MKYQEILGHLLDTLGKRDGEKAILALRESFHTHLDESLARASILFIISRQPFMTKVKLLLLYPELIAAYLGRLRV